MLNHFVQIQQNDAMPCIHFVELNTVERWCRLVLWLDLSVSSPISHVTCDLLCDQLSTTRTCPGGTLSIDFARIRITIRLADNTSTPYVTCLRVRSSLSHWSWTLSFTSFSSVWSCLWLTWDTIRRNSKEMNHSDEECSPTTTIGR